MVWFILFEYLWMFCILLKGFRCTQILVQHCKWCNYSSYLNIHQIIHNIYKTFKQIQILLLIMQIERVLIIVSAVKLSEYFFFHACPLFWYHPKWKIKPKYTITGHFSFQSDQPFLSIGHFLSQNKLQTGPH